MNKFWRKFERSIGIAGSAISLAGLGYSLWRSLSKKDLIPNQVYSVSDVAKILDISQEETIKLVQEGKITARQVGGRYKILGSSVASFLEA